MMREIANLSTHAALEQHGTRRLGTTALVKLFVAVMAVVTATLLWVWSPVIGPLALYGSFAVLAVAIFWGFRAALFAHSFWSVRRRQSAVANDNAASPASDASSSQTDVDALAEQASTTDA
jgi:hypothetical protein